LGNVPFIVRFSISVKDWFKLRFRFSLGICDSVRVHVGAQVRRLGLGFVFGLGFQLVLSCHFGLGLGFVLGLN